MEKSNKRKLLLALILVLVVAPIVVFHLWTKTKGIDLLVALPIELQYAEIAGILVTIIFSIQEFKGSKEIARGDFIMELNKSYVENPKYMEIYTILQDKLDGKGDKTNQITKAEISNYLTFFETIYLLEKNGVIDFKIIDDLFAYRFFLAVHSGVFQREKLGAQPKNFKNIFKLEREWMDYRASIGKDKEERDPNKPNVYIDNPLCELPYFKTEEKYEVFIKD